MTNFLPKYPTVPRRTDFRHGIQIAMILLGLASLGESHASADGCFGKEWERLECAPSTTKLTPECTQFLERFHDDLSTTLRSICEKNTCTSAEKAICSYLYRSATTRHRGTEKECDSELAKSKRGLASCQGEKSAAEGRVQKIQQDLDIALHDAAACREACTKNQDECNKYWQGEWAKWQQEKNSLVQRLNTCQAELDSLRNRPVRPNEGNRNDEISEWDKQRVALTQQLMVARQTADELQKKVEAMKSSSQKAACPLSSGVAAGQHGGQETTAGGKGLSSGGTAGTTIAASKLDKFAKGALWGLFSVSVATATTLFVLNGTGVGPVADPLGEIHGTLSRPAWALTGVAVLTLSLAIPYTVLYRTPPQPARAPTMQPASPTTTTHMKRSPQ